MICHGLFSTMQEQLHQLGNGELRICIICYKYFTMIFSLIIVLLRYLGGLVCTKDGELPPTSVQEEIWAKLRSAGIEPWELFVVDNRSDTPGAIAAGPPPLSR